MGTVYNTNVVTDGLVAYFDAANRASYPGTGTTWTELVAGNNGTLYNFEAGFFDSAHGGSLDFDGTDSYVRSSAPPPEGTGDWAVTFWVAIDSFSDNNFFIATYIINKFQFGIRPTSAAQWDIYFGSPGVTGNPFTNSPTMVLDQWYYIVATRIGSTLKIYRDGVEKVSTSNSQDIATAGGDVYFGIQHDGGDPGSFDHPLDGKMAVASIYNKGLTAAEVAQNYNATKRRFGL